MSGEDTSVERTFQSWAQDNREALVEYLLKLVAIETPSDDPAAFGPFFELLAADFQALGLETTRREGTETGGWLELSSGDGDEIQLILGHADTVWPHGTTDTRPPRQEDGVVIGPGSLDMKGGLTQLRFALAALDAQSLEPALPTVALISSDEEIGSPESRDRIIELAKRANRVIVLEPGEGTAGALKLARKSVGEFRIDIEGEAAHAGLEPRGGASAISELGRIIQRLDGMAEPEAGISVNVGTVDGGLRRNVIAPSASATIDVRAPTAETVERLERSMRTLAAETPGTSLTVSGSFTRPPMEPTDGNRQLWRRVRTIGERLGLNLDVTKSGGASDGNFASQHAPTIDGMGAVGDGAHHPDEYVEVDALVDRVALLAACLIDEPLSR